MDTVVAVVVALGVVYQMVEAALEESDSDPGWESVPVDTCLEHLLK